MGRRLLCLDDKKYQNRNGGKSYYELQERVYTAHFTWLKARTKQTEVGLIKEKTHMLKQPFAWSWLQSALPLPL